MIPVILTILKIIGIILLSIFGVLIALLLIILFVPIRYRVSITADGNNIKENANVNAKLSYLLNIFQAKYNYPDNSLNIYILFINITKLSKYIKNKKEKKNNKISKSEPSVKQKIEIEDSHKNVNSNLSIDIENDNNKKIDLVESSTNTNKTKNTEFNTEDLVQENNTNSKLKSKLSLFDKIKNIFLKLKNNIINIINNIRNKILHLGKNIDKYIKIIESPSFKKAFNICKKQIIKLLKLIRPKKIKGYINYGSDSPDKTAKIFGIYSAISPYLDKNFKLVPYLQESRIDGKVLIKGYIQIVSLIIIVIKVYFNKDIKKTIGYFKKENING